MSARPPLRFAVALLLGALAAVLVSCGGSGSSLIPERDAGPLVADFQAVEAAASTGNGRCTATETALLKTESDYRRLPSGVDAGLRGRLSEGIAKLHELALELCTQPVGGTTTTGPAVETTPPASTTPAETSTTSTTPPGTSTEGTSEGGTPPSAGEGAGTEGGTAPGASDEEGKPGESKPGEGAQGAGGEDGGATGGAGVGGGGH